MKNLSSKRFLSFVFSTMLMMVLASTSVAQRERPSKLASESANKALQDFKTAEQELVKKKEVKNKKTNKVFEETFGTTRGELLAELKKRLLEETKNGNLDNAVEIRSAISYFEKLKPNDPAGLEGRPRRLGSAVANKALTNFRVAERALTKKLDEKNKQLDKFFKQAHGELRDDLVTKLNKSLTEQTTAGNLDGALEIRSAVSYFNKMKLGDIALKSVKAPAPEVKPAEKDEATPAEKTGGLRSKITNSIGMEFKLIPAGEFLMGSETELEELVKKFRWKGSGEFPQHKVTISKPFYMGTYEVTVGDFKEFVAATGYKTIAQSKRQGGQGYDGSKFAISTAFSWQNTGFEQDDDHPVVNVTWQGAVRFCKWLSSKEKVTYRLPSEAEWEYACRGGSTSMYYNGNESGALTSIANVADTSLQGKLNKKTFKQGKVNTSDDCAFTNRVGQYLPNEFGLHDMTGNVAEICQDWFEKEYYAKSPAIDPPGAEQGEKRVVRGGGWLDDAYGCRTSYRKGFWPTGRNIYTGFRVIRGTDH